MKRHLTKNIKILAFLLIVVIGSNSYSQVKKEITRKFYPLWSTLVNQELSNDGEWALYSLYNAKGDTLFLRNTRTENTFAFPRGRQWDIDDATHRFMCMVDDNLNVVNLKTMEETRISNVADYKLSTNSRMLAVAFKDFLNTKGHDFRLENLQTGKMLNLKNIVEYAFNPKKNTLVIIQEGNINSVNLIDLKNFKIKILEASSNGMRFKGIYWGIEGESLVFLQELANPKNGVRNHRIIYYETFHKSPKRHVYDPTSNQSDDTPIIIPHNPQTQLTIAADQKRVFFEFQKAADTVVQTRSKSAVEIWSTDDEELYPLMNLKGFWSKEPKLAFWDSSSDEVIPIGSKSRPVALLFGNQHYALTFHPNMKQSLETFNPDRDLYIMNLRTRRSEFFMTLPGDGSIQQIILSPKGNYITYFKGQNWWLYNVLQKTHHNISENLPYPVYDENYDRAGYKPPSAPIIWAQDENSFFISDAFDIWRLETNNLRLKNLTLSRKWKQQYRIEERHTRKYQESSLWRGFYASSLDTHRPILLGRFDPLTKKSGYSVWTESGGLKEITFGNQKVSSLKKSGDYTRFSFVSESYNLPPALTLISEFKTEPQTIIRSNSQQKEFADLRAELIHYKGTGTDELQGILYYPTHFQKGKKYPMVTMIYETFSDEFHRYSNPSTLINPWNIGYRELLNAGYFVFLPDIDYALNEVCHSATTSVDSGVREILEKNYIDRGRLGIFGFSFGGYEVNCIITKTNMFNAAVSGAGASDALSFYLTIGKNDSKPEIFRYEHGMWRFKGPYHNNKTAYLKNSPVYHAENINTPLLLFTGKEDGQVDWHQSVEMYLALRRLQKPSKMLVYPNEDHVLLDKKNQLDSSDRILDWFNFYLKNETDIPWIEEGSN